MQETYVFVTYDIYNRENIEKKHIGVKSDKCDERPKGNI